MLHASCLGGPCASRADAAADPALRRQVTGGAGAASCDVSWATTVRFVGSQRGLWTERLSAGLPVGVLLSQRSSPDQPPQLGTVEVRAWIRQGVRNSGTGLPCKRSSSTRRPRPPCVAAKSASGARVNARLRSYVSEGSHMASVPGAPRGCPKASVGSRGFSRCIQPVACLQVCVPYTGQQQTWWMAPYTSSLAQWSSTRSAMRFAHTAARGRTGIFCFAADPRLAGRHQT